ncbi:hypothetical protein GIB67_013901 [Kingdonia uniflora]|uniref:EF-hand domain-containing protein n=1 Tax=Kingdonia uniflora TaxID=39325 RepID=A0A7J7LDE6_9MAGN|nr:hypothetical protein GIB67_013901 [Kingdonia uniflora]
MGRELEHGRRFYEELFREVIVEPSARKEVVRLIAEEEIELEDVRIVEGELIRYGSLGHQVERERFFVGSNLICSVVVNMKTSPVNETSTSGRSAESENVVSDKEGEIRVAKFPDFPGKLNPVVTSINFARRILFIEKKELFKAVDKNGDGVVNIDELANLLAIQQEKEALISSCPVCGEILGNSYVPSSADGRSLQRISSGTFPTTATWNSALEFLIIAAKKPFPDPSLVIVTTSSSFAGSNR